MPAAYGGLLCLKPSALWLFGKMLSPAAEAFRYFILERGEAHLAAMFAGEAARA